MRRGKDVLEGAVFLLRELSKMLEQETAKTVWYGLIAMQIPNLTRKSYSQSEPNVEHYQAGIALQSGQNHFRLQYCNFSDYS